MKNNSRYETRDKKSKKRDASSIKSNQSQERQNMRENPDY